MIDRPNPKYKRVELANEFIMAIASCGRRFFLHSETSLSGSTVRVAQFKLANDGKIWFLNEWLNKWIYVSKPGSWRGFHHGGTLHALVCAVVCFIKDGEPIIIPEYFDAKHWVYSEAEMQSIVTIGQDLGIVKGKEHVNQRKIPGGIKSRRVSV